jgi:triacylglycerol lipase
VIIPPLRSPVVLAHGLLGFDCLRLGRLMLGRYWPGIPEALTAAGNRVLVARVAPLGSVAQRAAQLKAFIDQHSPHDPVHIIAHSMGGLDSRYMISRLGMADRVLTLTTIGTPHRGSPFADWGMRRVEPVLGPLLDLIGVPRHAIRDLCTASVKALNEQCPDAPGVRYFSVAGRFKADWLTPGWIVSNRVVEQAQGPNDGLVALTSASYGEDCTVWEGDHVSLLNWPNPVARLRGRWQDRTPAYAGLVRRLKDEGF